MLINLLAAVKAAFIESEEMALLIEQRHNLQSKPNHVDGVVKRKASSNKTP